MDLSINNKNIIDYLKGNIHSLPEEELVYIMNNPNEPSFIGLLSSRISLAIHSHAINQTDAVPVNKVVTCNNIIATAIKKWPTATEGERKAMIFEVGLALRFLWQLADTTIAQRSKRD